MARTKQTRKFPAKVALPPVSRMFNSENTRFIEAATISMLARGEHKTHYVRRAVRVIRVNTTTKATSKYV